MNLVEDVHEYGVKQHTRSVSMLYVPQGRARTSESWVSFVKAQTSRHRRHREGHFDWQSQQGE